MKRIITYILITAMFTGLFTCLSGTTGAEAKKKKATVISTAYEEMTLNIGGSRGLRAKLESDPDAKITYTVSDPEIVSVNRKGKVTGLKSGSCVVTVTASNGTEKDIPVTVRPALKRIRLNRKSVKLAVMKTKELTVTFLPEGSYSKVTWESSDPTVAKVSKKGVVKALKAGTATITATTETGLTKSCEFTCYYSKFVAITFDDGPSAYTEKLLDALKEMDVHVTFFCVGTNVTRYPELIKRMKEEGHEIGNHTWDHPYLTKMSATEIKSTMKKTRKAIKEACGSNPTLMRPPYGSYNSTVLANVGLPAILWSVDTLDWKYRDADYVNKTVYSQAKDGSIILLHDIHKTSVDGAIKAIKRLKKDGWGFLTVTELLTQNGETIKAGQRYSQYKK